MAKHPVPKRRATSTRSSRRHQTFVSKTLRRLLDAAHIVMDKTSGEARLSHTGAPTKKKTAPKVTKVKA